MSVQGSHPTLGGGSAVPVATAPFVQPPSRFAPVCPYIYRAAMQGLFLTPAARPAAAPIKKDVAEPSSNTSSGAGAFGGDATLSSGGSVNHSQESDGRASISDVMLENSLAVQDSAPRSLQSALAGTAADASSSGPFLRSLRLKTILLMSPEHTPPKLKHFCDDERIQLVHCGLTGIINETCDDDTLAHSQSGTSGPARSNLLTSPLVRTMITERNVKEGLELLLDTRKHPILVLDTFGIHETGVLLGCLRKMMRWNFASIIVEYRAFAGSRTRASNERFIEMFDTELVTLPPQQWLPEWLIEDDRAVEESMNAMLYATRPEEPSS